MEDTMLQSQEWESLAYHLKEVSAGKRRFENAAQSVSRMILEKKIEKRIHAGKTVYDFEFFREGAGHIVSWYDEINDFVHFVKDAAQGGSAKEMAYVLVGEPGNGKTTFVEFVCKKYRGFLSRPENLKYTFKFVGLDQALDYDEKVATMPSLTFEDPMILAMNLFENVEKNMVFLVENGFNAKTIDELYRD